jgi:plastocyanin
MAIAERSAARAGAPFFFCAGRQLAEVRIEGYKFQPPAVTIKAGDSVRWTNHEKRTSHSVVFPAEGGLESDRLFPDESYQRRFDKVGRHDYIAARIRK